MDGGEYTVVRTTTIRPQDRTTPERWFRLWRRRVADAADFCKNRGFSGALRVSVARRQTRIVYDAFMDLVGAGKSLVVTGDVAAYMRDRDYPLDAWEIRGEFFQLRQMGLIDLDADTAQWFPVPGGDFDSARAASRGDGGAASNGQADDQ